MRGNETNVLGLSLTTNEKQEKYIQRITFLSTAKKRTSSQ